MRCIPPGTAVVRTSLAALLLSAAFVAVAFSQFDAGRFMASESLGPIRIGQPASGARALMHSESEEGAVTKSEADGRFHQSVEYPDEGVGFTFVSDSRKEPQEVFSARVKAPSKLRTKRGIGIGSTRSEVLAAYRDDIDKDLSADESLLVAGAIEGGVAISFTAGRVSEIFLGPIGE